MKNDIIYLLNEEFKSDTRPSKINGSIGIYLDNNNQPYVIPTVSQISAKINFNNYNYLPIDGDITYLNESTKLILGSSLYKKYNDLLVKQAVCGGTNGLYIWANYISNSHSNPNIIISNPTWENHVNIFKNFNFNIIRYRHLDKNNNFNLKLLISTIKKNPNSYILFQSGKTHNPTGINPNNNEWKILAKEIKKNNSKVIFDTPYAGLDLSIDDDCYCIRYFLQQNIDVTINFSYSKNMTLYQHRTGILITKVKSLNQYNKIKTTYKQLFRINNSSPPGYGINIVKNILTDNKLKIQWQKSLAEISNIVQERRNTFEKHTNNRFKSISKHSGFFSILNLNKNQIKHLKEKYAIYLLPNGRINFAGIPQDKIMLVTQAINSL